MRLILSLLLVLLLAACECDSICEANRSTNKFLDSKPGNDQIIQFLNQYKGEAPGAATYGAFVNWGLENNKQFIEILNDEKITKKNLGLIVYMIADYGNHDKFCEMFKELNERKNDIYVRERLLGCSYDANGK